MPGLEERPPLRGCGCARQTGYGAFSVEPPARQRGRAIRHDHTANLAGARRQQLRCIGDHHEMGMGCDVGFGHGLL